MTENYLLFRLGERLFGVRLQGAIEILPWRRPRTVPLANSYVEGILDYRGMIYPVFSLVQVLGLTKPGPIGFAQTVSGDERREQSIILLQEGDNPFGITVDSVVKMASLDEPSGKASEVKGMNTNVVKGVRYDDDQEIFLLSFERLFHAG